MKILLWVLSKLAARAALWAVLLFCGVACRSSIPRAPEPPVFEQGSCETQEACRKAARQGDVEARYRLGIMYREGKGVAKDNAEAMKWLSLASVWGRHPAAKEALEEIEREEANRLQKRAEQGEAEAQYGLSELYRRGQGVEKDEAQAAQWCSEAAKQGHPEAQYRLGEMAYNGTQGHARDKAQAAKWYTQAAKQGHTEAQYRLGLMYFWGTELIRDEAEALRWLRKAAEAEHREAQRFLPKVEARNQLREAAEQGDVKAQFHLGVSYSQGIDGARDEAEGLIWHRRAAKQGHIEAQRVWGLKYFEPERPQKDKAEPLKWLKAAAEQGDAEAQQTLRWMYFEPRKPYGPQVPREDKAEVLKSLKKIAEQGDTETQCQLGWIYFHGLWVQTNEAEGLKWMKRAAQQGNEKAQAILPRLEEAKRLSRSAREGALEASFQLGMLYMKGVYSHPPSEEDEAEALKWFGVAAKRGHLGAQYAFGKMNIENVAVEGVGNNVVALRWLKKAASRGHTQAQFLLWHLYSQGFEHGVDEIQDEAEALKWLRLSAKHGHLEAQEVLQRMKNEEAHPNP
ncbi:MAG: SEL1-like repeat protein [Cystobacterineae bacterium]|nr:SEL1-like repeat protein [Cystobacterineae bacterium]